MDFILSSLAERDLEGIYVYTVKTHGSDQLDVYARIIDTAIADIADDPLAIGSKSRDDLLPGCRFYRAGHHYIAYRVMNGRIEIGRVLHESMNFEFHLTDAVFDPAN